MTLEMHALASGSSGNVMLARADRDALLLDCGMARCFIENGIRGAGADPAQLVGIVLTHEHIDHARGALATARRYRVPLIASAGTLEVVVGSADFETRTLRPGEPVEVGEFRITGHPVPHDAREPMAVSVECGSTTVSYAVDLGQPEQALLQAFAASSLVVLEANHDVGRLTTGPYSNHLKERILGGRGHLSNQDAARVISAVSAGARPIRFWLAHLSAVNNNPTTALRSATRALRSRDRAHFPVEVALRDRPSLHWHESSYWWQPRLAMDW